MLVRQVLLALWGLCCGFTVAAGIFAFITMIGVIPRLAARTNTAKHIYLYEIFILLGGTLANIWYLTRAPIPLSYILLIIFGLFSGIFVGCLAMALAEMLRVLPIFVERLQIIEGFPILVIAIALGKMCGTLFQYFFG